MNGFYAVSIISYSICTIKKCTQWIQNKFSTVPSVLYQKGGTLALADILVIQDNMGVLVISLVEVLKSVMLSQSFTFHMLMDWLGASVERHGRFV